MNARNILLLTLIGTALLASPLEAEVIGGGCHCDYIDCYLPPPPHPPKPCWIEPWYCNPPTQQTPTERVNDFETLGF